MQPLSYSVVCFIRFKQTELLMAQTQKINYLSVTYWSKYTSVDINHSECWFALIYFFVSAGEATHSTCVQTVIGRSSACGFSTASPRSSVMLKKPIRRWLPSIGSTCDAPLTCVVFGHLFLRRTPSPQPIYFSQPSPELRSDFRDFPGLCGF